MPYCELFARVRPGRSTAAVSTGGLTRQCRRQRHRCGRRSAAGGNRCVGRREWPYALDLRDVQQFDSAAGEGITNVYDSLGRLASTKNSMDGTTRTLSYVYDAGGRRTRITHVGARSFTYS